MGFVVRDFNTPTNHGGDITICFSNDQIEVTILNLHESDYGQAWMYVKYYHELQQLKTIEENILIYLQTTLQKRWNYNSAQPESRESTTK